AAHLASTSAFRLGGYTASKGLVYFLSGDLKERLSRRWTDWRRTAALDPTQRPTAKPRPWKLQVYDSLVEWVVNTAAGGPTRAADDGIAGLLETIAGAGASVESANHGESLSDKPWPVVVTFRGSEDSRKVKVEHTSVFWNISPKRGKERPDSDVLPNVKANSVVGPRGKAKLHVRLPEDWDFLQGYHAFCDSRCCPTIVFCLVPVPPGPARKRV
ncbi:unnamed protein product, partial [Symbiodinium sp. CCMP2456]